MPKASQLPPDSTPTTTGKVLAYDVDSLKDVLYTLTDLITLFFANIPSGVITASKLSLGQAKHFVATSETTTSASFTGLTTPHTVTVTVGANGILLLHYGAQTSNSGANVNTMSFAMSGANTQAASEDTTGAFISTGTSQVSSGVSMMLTGLTPGSTVVTGQYKTTGGTATYLRRFLIAIPL